MEYQEHLPMDKKVLEETGVYLETFQVRHREVDCMGQLKLISWFDYLQEVAANHANQLGVGWHKIREQGMIWVLSRLKLEILQYPPISGKLIIETYPSGINRLFFNREFRIFSPDGENVAIASSAWLLLAVSGKRPQRPHQLKSSLPDNQNLPRNFILDNKLSENTALPNEYAVQTRFTMEDINGHLNNAEYAGLVHDYAVQKIPGYPRFQSVEMNYYASVHAPEMIHLSGSLDKNQLFVQGRNSIGNLCFVARALIKG